MEIANNILKDYLQNVYFITGTAYAGKSTMVKMLAERFDLIACGENYHSVASDKIATPRYHPNICYFQTMSSWQEFVSRKPEVYAKWIKDTASEAAQFEIAELLRLTASGKKIIVDTNISLSLLKEISDYNRVAVMLSPQNDSVNRFFEREDVEKRFLLEQIKKSPTPDETYENFKNCIAEVNSDAQYNEYANSGFFTYLRKDYESDTREEVLSILAKHFGFKPVTL